MPCNSDYLEASFDEIEQSKLFHIMDELDGKLVDPKIWGNGYDERVYNKILPKQERDALVAKICARLQNTDVSKLSLEAQIWWRDHQLADMHRLRREEEQRALMEAQRKALEKLTPDERKLLGLLK